MTKYLMPQSLSWWVWVSTAILLALGIAGVDQALEAAIILSVVQTIGFVARDRRLSSYPVQIRVAYTGFLFLYYAPPLRWLYCVPMLGTFALVLFGYCLMARMLSLMPWNREEKMSTDLFLRTFLTPPMLGNPAHGLPSTGCASGVCDMEAQIARRSRTSVA